VIRAVLLLLFTVPASAEPTLQQIVQRKALRVGMHAGASPFVAEGKDCDELRKLVPALPARTTRGGQRLCGLDVELAQAAAQALGVALDVELVDRFDDLLPGLRAGRYDVAVAAITRTLERATTVSFTAPYFASGLEVRVRDPARFPTLESLRKHGVKVAFQPGTTAESFARAELPGAMLVPADDLFAAIDDPARADAVVIDFVTARDAEVRGRVHATLQPVEDRRFTVEELAMAVKQGDPDWLAWLNLFIDKEKTSGAFHKLAARFNAWFKTER
jgi:polar amino acid transport system substrate-binding protein